MRLNYFHRTAERSAEFLDVLTAYLAAGGNKAAAAKKSHLASLMDVRMPGMDGIRATQVIAADPGLAAVRIVILTTFDLNEYVYGAPRARASFVLKASHQRTCSAPSGWPRPGAPCSTRTSPAGSSQRDLSLNGRRKYPPT